MSDTWSAMPSATPPPTQAGEPTAGYDLKRSPQVREVMTEEEFQTTVSAAIDDAESYVDDNLSPEQATATEYYYGKPLGNEQPGRSQIVMSEVRDVVHMLMPGLMRVFTGASQVVEFVPVQEEDVPMAEQATDYCEYVFM